MTAITYEYPDPFRTLGIDVHQYTGVVNWQAAKSGGIRFALVKAKNGINTSRYFKENWQGAKDAGVLRNAWLWVYPNHIVSGGAQARALIDLLGSDPGELPIALDYEWTTINGVRVNPNESDLYGIAKPLEDHYGRKVMIYSAPGYLNQYPLKADYWKDCPLWLANYKVAEPITPKPWTRWNIWQWTEAGYGNDYGVNQYAGERAVDLNYFNGTVEDLYEFAASNYPSPTIPNEEPMEYRYELTPIYTNGCSVRPAPNTDNTKHGTLAYGQRAKGNVLSGDGVNELWLRVLEVNGSPVLTESWVAIIHEAQSVSRLTENPTGPTVPPTNPASVDLDVKVSGAEVGSVSVNGTPYTKA